MIVLEKSSNKVIEISLIELIGDGRYNLNGCIQLTAWFDVIFQNKQLELV